MRRLVLIVLLASAASAASTAAAAAQTGAAAKSPRPAAVAPRDIPQQELEAVAQKTLTLRASPATLVVRVGQTVSLDSVVVVAVDGLGHDLGRLRAFDFGIKPGEAATVMPRQVTGVRAGATDLTVRFPRSAWGARTAPRPFAVVHVVVKP